MVSDRVRENYEMFKSHCVQGSIDAKKSFAIGAGSLAMWGPYALSVAFNASNEILNFTAMGGSFGTMSGIYGLAVGVSCLSDSRKCKEEVLQMEQKYPELKLDIK